VGGRVLIVDDEDSILVTMGAALERDGYSVMAARTGTVALELVATESLDVAIVDLHLGDINGLEIVSYMRQNAPGALAIILTGYASTESAVDALRLGAYDYLIKPTDAYELLATVARAMERRRLELRVAEQMAELHAANRIIRALNADLKRRVDEAASALQHRIEQLRLLAEASAVLSASLEFEDTLLSVARVAVPTLADWCSVDLLEEGQAPRGLAGAHRDPAKDELIRELQRLYPPDPGGRQPISQVLRTGQPVLLPQRGS